MSKIKVIATEDLTAYPYTWTKGFDYEIVQKDDYFILASNEGQVNYYNEVKDQVMENFEMIS